LGTDKYDAALKRGPLYTGYNSSIKVTIYQPPFCASKETNPMQYENRVLRLRCDPQL